MQNKFLVWNFIENFISNSFFQSNEYTEDTYFLITYEARTKMVCKYSKCYLDRKVYNF